MHKICHICIKSLIYNGRVVCYYWKYHSEWTVDQNQKKEKQHLFFQNINITFSVYELSVYVFCSTTALSEWKQRILKNEYNSSIMGFNKNYFKRMFNVASKMCHLPSSQKEVRKLSIDHISLYRPPTSQGSI